MQVNYKESAKRMIKATMRSEAQVMTQWADIDPLTSWVTEWEDRAVPDERQMQRALDKQLRKMTNQGTVSPLGTPYGGIKLSRSVNDTWLLSLYSQFDTTGLIEMIKKGVEDYE